MFSFKCFDSQKYLHQVTSKRRLKISEKEVHPKQLLKQLLLSISQDSAIIHLITPILNMICLHGKISILQVTKTQVRKFIWRIRKQDKK